MVYIAKSTQRKDTVMESYKGMPVLNTVTQGRNTIVMLLMVKQEHHRPCHSILTVRCE